MPDEQHELEFSLQRVGDGPVFEVLLNNVRLDITRAGQLYSIRCSGLITERQVHRLQNMFTHLFTATPPEDQAPIGMLDQRERFQDGALGERIGDRVSDDEDGPPFDGPYGHGPILP